MAQEAPQTEGETPDTEKPQENTEPSASGKSPEGGFDKEYVSSLRSEAAGWRIKAQQASEKLEEYEQQNQSELEKAQTKAQKAEKAKLDAESKLLRFEVAAEKQIPADAMELLTGNTREELEAKADKLLELTKNRNTNDSPDFDGGAREPAPDPNPESAHNDVALALLGLK